jgi:hypothetical protein
MSLSGYQYDGIPECSFVVCLVFVAVCQQFVWRVLAAMVRPATATFAWCAADSDFLFLFSFPRSRVGMHTVLTISG